MLSFTFQYGSFWRRAAALVIDLVVIAVIAIIFLDPTLTFLGLHAANAAPHRAPESVEILRGYGAWAAATIAAAWIYFSLMESSRMQATLGKRIMGLMVFTRQEERLTFREASFRFWAKALSVMTGFLGFFSALRDKKHRALHDRIVGSIVVQPRPDSFASATK